MAPIEFYTMPESVPCRTVELVAVVVGVKLNKHLLNLFAGDHMKEEYTKLNPWHKVPFIIDGDLKLNESRAIVQYLANKYLPADNTLYPHDPIKRAKVDELLYWDIGTVYNNAAKAFYYKFRQPHLDMDPEAEQNYRATLKALDELLEGKKYLLGDNYTLADIAISCGLTFTESCDYDFSEFKNVTKWLATCKKELPHFHEINDAPSESMRQIIITKRKEAGKA